MHKYPQDTPIKYSDFINAGWKDAVAGADDQSYSALWFSLSRAASNALAAERPTEGKVLWILSDVCSMTLRPKITNDPFGIRSKTNDVRTIALDDLSDEDLGLLGEAAPLFDNALLRARIADIVWLCQKPRQVKYALIAIEAYKSVPLNSKTWVMDARDCWERAIFLSHQVRATGNCAVDQIEMELLQIFDAASVEDGYFRDSISTLLKDGGIGRSNARHCADTLTCDGKDFNARKNHYAARRSFEAASAWYAMAGDKEMQADLARDAAEAVVLEAEMRLSAPGPGNMAAASFFEDAIQLFRRIPKKYRDSRGIDERIEQVRVLLEKAGRGTVDELVRISSGTVDVQDIVEQSKAAIQGKDFVPAMKSFAAIHRIKFENLSKSAAKSLRDYPLKSLFAATHMSRDGRVVAKTPGAGLSSTDSEDYKKSLWGEIVSSYVMEIAMITQCVILPAMDVLLLEHRVREMELQAICKQCPIIPPGRSSLFARGLAAGFDRDFVVAQHLLVGQLENMVRYHLKVRGILTTTISPSGIETENGLSTLADLPEMTQIFGEDIAFEIKVLFCDSLGPNLRNDTAHGLLEEISFFQPSSVYAWWWMFRLTFVAFWNATHENQSPAVTETNPQ